MFGFSIQELLVLMLVITVLSLTGLWPRVIQGLRELRGDAPPPQNQMSRQERDMCYRVLGLSSSAKWPEVEKAYRQKAKIHHPDKGGDEDMMRALNEAYNQLKKYCRP